MQKKTKLIDLADKHIKTTIINSLHMFKQAEVNKWWGKREIYIIDPRGYFNLELKCISGEIMSRLNSIEEKISELENIIIQTSQNETKKKKGLKNNRGAVIL